MRRAKPACSPLFLALIPLLAFAAATQSAAEMGPVAAVRAATLIDMSATGAPDAVVDTDGRVVFRNRVTGSTRIVLTRKDASAFDCVVDGDAVVRSRPGQYLLRGGAELSCVVRPGRYRYTTLTQQRGGIHKARSTIRVRN